jgi:hypothetical protein
MIRPSSRTAQFHYAIRNIVGAAEERERRGQPVIYLNIGDPQAYGFRPPAHVTEAVTRALVERFTGYAHSAGLSEAREAVAAYATRLGAATTRGMVRGKGESAAQRLLDPFRAGIQQGVCGLELKRGGGEALG